MNAGIAKIFVDLVVSGVLADAFSSGVMPNVPFPTMGGEVFWDNLASVKGWRLQRNCVFGNCRILDPSDIRRAWGSESGMMSLFERLNHD